MILVTIVEENKTTIAENKPLGSANVIMQLCNLSTQVNSYNVVKLYHLLS